MLNGYAVSEEFNLRRVYDPFMADAECEALCASLRECRSYSFRKITRQCALKTATCAEAGIGKGCRLVKAEVTSLQLHRDKTSEWSPRLRQIWASGCAAWDVTEQVAAPSCSATRRACTHACTVACTTAISWAGCCRPGSGTLAPPFPVVHAPWGRYAHGPLP